MRSLVSAFACASALVLAASGAQATVFDLTLHATTPGPVMNDPWQPWSQDFSFAPVALHIGDTLHIDVVFDQFLTITHPGGRSYETVNYGLPTHNLDNGFVYLSFDPQPPFSGAGDGFSTDIQLTSPYLPSSDPFTYEISSYQFLLSDAPEPSSWALATLGVAALGALLRARRRQGGVLTA